MKTLFILFAFLFSFCATNAQSEKYKIIFEKNDGNIILETKDIENISFIKSDISSFVSVYLNTPTRLEIYDLNIINHIEFTNKEFVILTESDSVIFFAIKNIDSILIKPKPINNIESVIICNKTWMKTNLNVSYFSNGEPIRYASSVEDWVDITNKKQPGYCYYNFDTSNEPIYGKLYNWYAVNDIRGLAPMGWYIPNEAEITEFINCMGGFDITGGKLKSVGTIEEGTGLWKSPNVGASNTGGFGAVPGGLYFPPQSRFDSKGTIAYFWLTDVFDKTRGKYFRIHNDNAGIFIYTGEKYIATSVRCLKK